MLKLSLSVLIALTLVGCGKKATDPKLPRAIDNTRYSSKPIPLQSARSNKSLCSVTQYDDQQRQISLSLFLNGLDAEEEKNFVGLIDGLQVRDIGAKTITESQKGQSTLYNYFSIDGVISGTKEEISVPSLVTVCPDDGKYPRGSIESAALNANYFLHKTKKKVNELAPEVEISPIAVKISPLIKKKLIVKEKGVVTYTFEAFETDNAYYAPGEKAITFLPHSEEFRKAGFTMSFWEVPMVASHEYGHHIFESIYPGLEGAGAHKNCFGRFGINEEKSQKDARKVTNEDVLYALNEGFADLVSYYSLSDNERGLKGVPCLETARDVGSHFFADNTEKVFSEKALAEFFAQKESEGPATCEKPNFQDIHIIGAIFANGADRFLSLSNTSKDQRLQIVIKWLQALRSKAFTMSALSPQDFLRDSFKLFVETVAAKTDGKVDPVECFVANTTYPGIDTQIEACRSN